MNHPIMMEFDWVEKVRLVYMNEIVFSIDLMMNNYLKTKRMKKKKK